MGICPDGFRFTGDSDHPDHLAVIAERDIDAPAGSGIFLVFVNLNGLCGSCGLMSDFVIGTDPLLVG